MADDGGAQPDSGLVATVRGLIPNDGGDRFFAPRNIIAFAVIILFAAHTMVPYWVKVPDGRTGDLIISGGKTVETVVMLVLAFFFGTTVTSSKKDETIRQQALAMAPSSSIDPTIIAGVALGAGGKDPTDAPSDAVREPAGAAGAAGAPGVQTGLVGPAE
jgi:hypothetical protein